MDSDTPRARGCVTLEIDMAAAGFEPSRPTLRYQCALVSVAAAMLLMPLAYLSIVLVIGYALWLHAVYDGGLAAAGPFGLLLFMAPFPAAAVLMFFTLKPFLAPAVAMPRLRIDDGREPLLVDLIERICRRLNVPRPHRIDVDVQANASASLERGWRALARRRIALTIGLPLVAGLSMRQFAGVLAHELGHFGQGGAMRLTALISWINVWFARVAYERDAWDLWLEEWSSSDVRFMPMAMLARAGVWGTRAILKKLLRAGIPISCLLQRQMEYDADRCQALVAGSDSFEACTRRIHELALARQLTEHDLQRSWIDRRLPDDLPRVVACRLRSASPEVVGMIDTSLERTTGRLDTHPAASDRVRAVRELSAAGVVRSDRPASALFADFSSLSRDATRFFYQQCRRLPVDEAQLVPADDFLNHIDVAERQRLAWLRFFEGTPFAIKSVPAAPPGTWPADMLVRRAAEARERMHGGRQRTAALVGRTNELWRQFAALTLARPLSVLGVVVPQAMLNVSPADIRDVGMTAAIGNARSRIAAERDAVRSELEPAERSATDRIEAALGLLHHTHARLLDRDAAPLLDEAIRIRTFVNAVSLERQALLELYAGLEALQVLARLPFAQRPREAPSLAVVELNQAVLSAGRTLCARINGLPYPIVDENAITLDAYLARRDGTPSTEPFARLLLLNERCFHRLFEIVDAVESAWLAPLESELPLTSVEPASNTADRERADAIAELERRAAAALDPENAAFDRLLHNRTPRLVITPLLIAVNTVVYVTVLATSGPSFDGEALLRWGASYGPLAGAGEWWRALTGAFVHAGVWHLLLNMFCLFQVGAVVERLLGPAMFLVCYLAMAVAASCVGLLIHPNNVSVGASGAVFGMFGILASTVVRARHLSVRELVDETVAALSGDAAPPSGPAITTLGLSGAGAASQSVVSASIGSPASAPDDYGTAGFGGIVLRKVYSGVAGFVIFNLLLSVGKAGIDTAALVGGLLTGIPIGWLVAGGAISAKPPLIRVLLPLAISALIGAATIGHLTALAVVRFETARFSQTDRRGLTAFNTALLQMRSGRATPEDVAAIVDRKLLPTIADERQRSRQILSELRKELAEVDRLDRYGRVARWRELQPLRNRIALALAWQTYLGEREADWRLRAEGLRQRAPEKMNDANRRDEAAAQRLAAALRRPE